MTTGIYEHKPHSQETKLKIGLANKGKKHSQEFREAVRQRRIGKKFSQDVRLKMSLSHKGKKPIQACITNKGKKRQQSTKDKISIANSGQNHYAYNPNKLRIDYPIEWGNRLKEAIRKRDNYVCQDCGLSQEKHNKKLIIHHIDKNKKNCNPKNLITLCKNCHARKHLCQFNR